MEGKQQEQKVVVQGLQQQQKTIQAVIADQRQKDAAINAQIDRLIAQEVAKLLDGGNDCAASVGRAVAEALLGNIGR